MQRGKFRPRLVALATSNSEATVEKVTTEAFRLLPNVKAASKALCDLKGIGPATASGVSLTEIDFRLRKRRGATLLRCAYMHGTAVALSVQCNPVAIIGVV